MKGRCITEEEWDEKWDKKFINNLRNAVVDAIIEESKKMEEDVVLHNIISAGAKFDCVQRCAKIECNYLRKEEKRHELNLHNHEFKVKLKTMKRR